MVASDFSLYVPVEALVHVCAGLLTHVINVLRISLGEMVNSVMLTGRNWVRCCRRGGQRVRGPIDEARGPPVILGHRFQESLRAPRVTQHVQTPTSIPPAVCGAQSHQRSREAIVEAEGI